MILEAKTVSGRVRGFAGKRPGNAIYLGIPYAKAPTGTLRYAPPEAAAPWEGVRCCQTMTAAPVQSDRSGTLQGTENCLTLNLYTPADTDADRLPVLVWIYGGAFNGGSNSDPMFDGEAFAEKGAVIVVINYRVGPLGFFSTELLEACMGTPVNAGLMDQIAALHWIRENVAAFGGNPDCVTVFGQSAGGISVRMLLNSPAAEGLFHRAIVQSGGGLNEADPVRSKGEFQQLCSECLSRLGWTEDDLFRRDAYELTSQLERTARDVLAGSELALFQPFIDGITLTDVPGKRIARGLWANVPVICGSVAGDSWMFSRKVRDLIDDPDCFRGFALSPGQAWARQSTVLGHLPLYTYYMDRTQPQRATLAAHGVPPFGASTPHGSEIAYLFGTLSAHGQGYTEFDTQIADQMRQYWVNFAASGDPNGSNLPEWPAFTEPARLSLHIGDNSLSVENLVQTAAEERVIAYTMKHPGMLSSLENF